MAAHAPPAAPIPGFDPEVDQCISCRVPLTPEARGKSLLFCALCEVSVLPGAEPASVSPHSAQVPHTGVIIDALRLYAADIETDLAGDLAPGDRQLLTVVLSKINADLSAIFPEWRTEGRPSSSISIVARRAAQ